MSENSLAEVKDRLNIFHSTEDEKLKLMVESSIASLKDLIPNTSEADSRFKTLVYERVLYMYNDQLAFFESNYQAEILNLSIATMVSDNES